MHLAELSVVVTNYNYGRYLARCLRSILSQDIERNLFEIILVDDGSTDDSMQIAEIFESEITIIQNSINRGLSKSSNLGIQKARGRYVTRIDSDDYVHSNFVRTLLVGFELLGKDFQAISVDYHKVDEIGNFLAYGDAEREPIACGIGFKMDAISTLGYYNDNLRVNEEVDLRRRFDEASFSIRNIKLPLYRYVQHDKSLSRNVLI